MFETATIPAGGANQRILATGMGVAGQTLLMACAVAIPLLFPAVLPKPEAIFTWVEVPTLTRPEPVRASVPEPVVHNAPPLQDSRGVIYEPVRTPTTVTRVEDPPPPVGFIPGLAREGVDRLSALIGRAVPFEAIAPAPVAVVEKTPAPPETVATKRVRQGGNIVAAQPLRRVEPVYPEIAVRTRVSGKVELEGVIGIDGRIHELRAVSGSPLLIRAALDAVRQWVYKPLLLNGEAVEVVQSIVVTFNLK